MPKLSAKVRVAGVASRRWGRVSAEQLAALGVADSTTAEWVDGGYLHRLHPRVYSIGHRATSVEGDLAAALLYAGHRAMLSHATALWWHGVIDRQPWLIEVSTPRRCRSLHGVNVHGRRNCRRVWHKGLPVTTVEQALLDFAARAPIDRVRYALANADYLKVLDVAALRAIAGRVVRYLWAQVEEQPELVVGDLLAQLSRYPAPAARRAVAAPMPVDAPVIRNTGSDMPG